MLTNNEINIVEKFISKSEPIMDFYEVQAIVKMQYDIYKLLLLPTRIIHYEEDDKDVEN